MVRPTLADWMTATASPWAFRHVRELIPCARVAARAPTSAIDARAHGLLDLTFTDPGAGERTLAGYLAASHSDALVVIGRRGFTFQWYRDGVRADDRHIVFSVSKSVTGLLAGALAGAGMLDLDGGVVELVPEVRGSGYGDASVRQLLDMTAAVRFTEDYSLANAEMQRYRKAAGWMPGASDEGLHAFLCTLPSTGRHGASYRYHSPTTDMLGWVCERASGLSFAEALSVHVWTPMGAEADADVTVDQHGAARAAGGLSMTARDMARVGRLLVDAGTAVIPRWFVDDLYSGGDPALWDASGAGDDLPGAAYRSCWYELNRDRTELAAFGIHGQMIYVDRARQVVVAKQSHWPQPQDVVAKRTALAVSAAIADAL